MRFVGISLSDDPPDDTTIVKFRNRIEGRRILSNALAYINSQLERRGLILKQGASSEPQLAQRQQRETLTRGQPSERRARGKMLR
jgi:IS5 family transposase